MATSNIRDVAGLPTDDGRRTRPGVLLRGDAPFADDAPPGLDWPPGVVIDLRTTEELDDPHPLTASGAAVHHLPLTDALAPDAVARGEAGELRIEELYVLLADGAAAWLPQTLRHLVDGPWPVLVHCAAGKDRTGVAVAVLLRLAGVTRAAVEADFSRTNARRGVLRDRLVRRGALDADDHASGVGVESAHLAPVLDRLDGDGAHRLARAAGVEESVLARWREVLLIPSD